MSSISSFNWTLGSWSNKSIDKPDVKPGVKPDIKLCIAGDWAPIREFQDIIDKTPDTIYGDLLPLIQSADLSIVNLEAPLSDNGKGVCKSGAVFKGEQKHIKGLTAANFDVVTLANNHMFDYGITAFKESLDVLEQNNIKYTGAGMSKEEAASPLILDVKGIKIGIVNFSEGEDLTAANGGPGVMGWDLALVSKTIKSLKETVDFIIVISHCGIEYIPFPPPYVTNAFKQMADAGANLVIGHHPHVPQGLSFYNNVPICYSLGNFIFYQETDLKYRKLGYMVNIGIKKDSLVSFEIIPYKIHANGLSTLMDKELSDFFEKFKQISMPLDNAKMFEESWNGFLDYYGKKGFFNEISSIMEKFKHDPAKGAAMFRNRLTTLQHYNHWKDFMTRIIEGTIESSPKWARDITKEWFTAKIDQ